MNTIKSVLTYMAFIASIYALWLLIVAYPARLLTRIIEYQGKQDSLIWEIKFEIQDAKFKIDSLELSLSYYRKQQNRQTNSHSNNNP